MAKGLGMVQVVVHGFIAFLGDESAPGAKRKSLLFFERRAKPLDA